MDVKDIEPIESLYTQQEFNTFIGKQRLFPKRKERNDYWRIYLTICYYLQHVIIILNFLLINL
jgi:hypothetical protein